LDIRKIRAARALLDWRQDDLAKKAKLSTITVKNIERGATQPRPETALKIRQALESSGIKFVAKGISLAA
jgi:DNA-binding XRE family transcriptional regulator